MNNITRKPGWKTEEAFKTAWAALWCVAFFAFWALCIWTTTLESPRYRPEIPLAWIANERPVVTTFSNPN